jgi:hypothetical protein
VGIKETGGFCVKSFIEAMPPNSKPLSELAVNYPFVLWGLKHSGVTLADQQKKIVKNSVSQSPKQGVKCFNCSKPLQKVYRCGRCQLAVYCGGACQTEAWKEHKLGCKKKE